MVRNNTRRDFFGAKEEFLKHCTIKGLSRDSVKFYQKELKGLSRALVDLEVSLSDVRTITVSDIENCVEFMLKNNRAVSSINVRLRAGRTFFNFCLKKEYIDKNPFDGVSQLKKRHTVGTTYTKNQLNKLLEATDITQFVGLRDLAIMLIFAYTGIRLKELCSFKVQDLSFEGSGEVVVQQAKNRLARRIPMTKRLKKVLKASCEDRGVINTDTLFISIENESLNQRTVQERLIHTHYGKLSNVEKDVLSLEG